MTTDEFDLEVMVGRKVRRIREQRGWSQSDLGARLGRHGHSMQQSTVAKLEAGSRPLRVNELGALARVFGVAPQTFVQYDAGSPLLDAVDRVTETAIRLEEAEAHVTVAEAQIAAVKRAAELSRADHDRALAEYRKALSEAEQPSHYGIDE